MAERLPWMTDDFQFGFRLPDPFIDEMALPQLAQHEGSQGAVRR